MFDANSRYARLEVVTGAHRNGREIAYIRRRFLPRARELDTLARVRIQEGDRLDSLAERTLGNSEAWWRIADAADALNPNDLMAEVGDELRIPVPKAT